MDDPKIKADMEQMRRELLTDPQVKIGAALLKGKRVRLVRCTDRYTHLPVGLEGTIAFVDDTGTVHVAWDNGSRLGLCLDAGDEYEILP
jgi:hypothetical protein